MEKVAINNITYNIDFESTGASEIGHCKKCYSSEFGIDRINKRVYIYCKCCGEEVAYVNH